MKLVDKLARWLTSWIETSKFWWDRKTHQLKKWRLRFFWDRSLWARTSLMIATLLGLAVLVLFKLFFGAIVGLALLYFCKGTEYAIIGGAGGMYQVKLLLFIYTIIFLLILVLRKKLAKLSEKARELVRFRSEVIEKDGYCMVFLFYFTGVLLGCLARISPWYSMMGFLSICFYWLVS